MNTESRNLQITQQDLMRLGADRLAYIKAVSIQDKLIWRIHAADGTEMADVGNRDLAFAACLQQGLEPVSVH